MATDAQRHMVGVLGNATDRAHQIPRRVVQRLSPSWEVEENQIRSRVGEKESLTGGDRERIRMRMF